MDKKGLGTAVDWIIAVGIFLVYFGLVFVFFKPGVQDVFDSDTLLTLVEENLINETEWSMTKTPIFIEKVPGSNIGDGEVWFEGLKDYLGEVTNGKSKFFNVGEELEKETESGKGFEKLKNVGKKNANLKIDKKQKDGDPLIYVEFNDEDKAKVVLISSKSELGEGVTPKGDEIDPINSLCSFKDYKKSEELGEEISCGAHYSVGASEKLKGLKLEGEGSIEGLRINVATDYDEIKEQWGFPDVKDFRIVFYSNSEDLSFEESDNDLELVIGLQKPSLDSQVYVREFNTFVLSEDGIKVPITINIRVW